MANAKWQMPNGKCQMPNGKCQMANGKWQMPNGETATIICHLPFVILNLALTIVST
jgi:hypothetical protein